jgi:flagellar motor protein MotB
MQISKTTQAVGASMVTSRGRDQVRRSLLTASGLTSALFAFAIVGGAPNIAWAAGHTDTSGGFAYNMRLSERRAKATADALVGQGVNQSVLKVDWKGKTDLAVQTPDGVKEPLNRRSTISINF